MLIKTPAYLKMKFYPSYAAFTFPFVITAIGLKMAMACLGGMGHPVPALSYVVAGETVIASVLTIYALVRYGMAVLNGDIDLRGSRNPGPDLKYGLGRRRQIDKQTDARKDTSVFS